MGSFSNFFARFDGIKEPSFAILHPSSSFEDVSDSDISEFAIQDARLPVAETGSVGTSTNTGNNWTSAYSAQIQSDITALDSQYFAQPALEVIQGKFQEWKTGSDTEASLGLMTAGELQTNLPSEYVTHEVNTPEFMQTGFTGIDEITAMEAGEQLEAGLSTMSGFEAFEADFFADYDLQQFLNST
jgi:hypothetical protein